MKAFSFFNREYLSKVKIMQNEQKAIRIITFILNRDSLQMTKAVIVPFSQKSFETIIYIYLKEFT